MHFHQIEKKTFIRTSLFIDNAIMGTISALTESEIQAIKDPDLDP